MITKEHKTKKYCCFYVSEFHLEMILLPYIKNNDEGKKFFICTEENLSESVKQVLERTNLNKEEQNLMLNLNWNSKTEDSIYKYNLDNYTIIVNGSEKYISSINEKLKEINAKETTVIDCYNINGQTIEKEGIKRKYDDILNTQKYKKR